MRRIPWLEHGCLTSQPFAQKVKKQKKSSFQNRLSICRTRKNKISISSKCSNPLIQVCKLWNHHSQFNHGGFSPRQFFGKRVQLNDNNNKQPWGKQQTNTWFIRCWTYQCRFVTYILIKSLPTCTWAILAQIISGPPMPVTLSHHDRFQVFIDLPIHESRPQIAKYLSEQR